MKVNKKWLKGNACSEAVRWVIRQDTTDFTELVKRAKKINRHDWINWYIARKMNKTQRVKYAIYAAEKVIHIFEEKYPDDKRPREAINAAKEYLKVPSSKNKKAAADAAVAAYAYADADADAYAAAGAAAAAAAAAAAYAYAGAAAGAAAYAYAAAAADAYAAAVAAADAKNKMYNQIVNYGIILLKGGK